MIQIRPEQVKALERASMERFVQELVNYLRQDFSVETRDIEDEELHELSCLSIERGKKFGLTREKDLTHFAAYCASYGWDFPSQQAWAKPTLERSDLESGAKIRQLAALELKAIRDGKA